MRSNKVQILWDCTYIFLVYVLYFTMYFLTGLTNIYFFLNIYKIKTVKKKGFHHWWGLYYNLLYSALTYQSFEKLEKYLTNMWDVFLLKKYSFNGKKYEKGYSIDKESTLLCFNLLASLCSPFSAGKKLAPKVERGMLWMRSEEHTSELQSR